MKKNKHIKSTVRTKNQLKINLSKIKKILISTNNLMSKTVNSSKINSKNNNKNFNLAQRVKTNILGKKANKKLTIRSQNPN